MQILTGSNSGSGVIFEVSSGTAWIVTNHHVVEGSSHVRVLVNDANWYDATVHGSDSVRDLAVLSVCCSPSFQAVELAGQRARQGADVFVMGYPLDSSTTQITRGIVSSVSRHSQWNAWVVQTDAPVNPGNSGGPLFTMDGKVAGIVTAKVEQTDDGRPVEGTGFAVASETVLGELPSLKIGSTTYAPPPTATPAPQATPGSSWGSLRSFGPADGSMRHEDDGYIEEYPAGVHLEEFSAQATFENPYGRSTGGWDYGFIFRGSGEERFHAVVVASDGWWSHYLREGSGDRNADPIAQGRLSSLRTGASGLNEMRVVATGERGWFFLNDRFVAELDLSGGATEGDVAVITGYHEGNEIEGRSTRFTGFAVSEPRFLAERSGQLNHNDDDLIKWEELRANTRDFIAYATFTNPYSAGAGGWDYGFGFRHTGFNRYHAVLVHSSSNWEHFLSEGSNDRAHEASGWAALDTGANGQNTLLLLAVGGAGVLYVNGVQVAALDLSGSTASGDIAVATGFYEGNERPGYSTGYDEFQVWSLD